MPQTIRRKKHKNNTIYHAVHACTTARYHSGARGADAAAEPKAGVGSEDDCGSEAEANSEARAKFRAGVETDSSAGTDTSFDTSSKDIDVLDALGADDTCSIS